MLSLSFSRAWRFCKDGEGSVASVVVAAAALFSRRRLLRRRASSDHCEARGRSRVPSDWLHPGPRFNSFYSQPSLLKFSFNFSVIIFSLFLLRCEGSWKLLLRGHRSNKLCISFNFHWRNRCSVWRYSWKSGFLSLLSLSFFQRWNFRPFRD